MRFVKKLVGASLLVYSTLAFTQPADLVQAAKQGDARAQAELGDLFFTGEGVPENNAEAAKWYRLAAEQGHAEAQFLFGCMFTLGMGVTKNYAEAIKWFRMAADQGHADAQHELGLLFHNGQGVPKNYGEAYFWQSLAASQNDKYRQARDATEKLLTPQDVSAIQARTAAWRPKPSTE